jgi:hypothetical protein
MTTRLFIILALTANTFFSPAQAQPLSVNNPFKTELAFINDIKNGISENKFDLEGTAVKVTSESKSIVVNLGKVTKEEVSIKIEDAEGNVLLAETVKEIPFFAKRYNLSQLEKGNYKLTITKSTVRTVQPFQVTTEGIQISEIEKKEKFLPVLNQKGSKLDVNVLLGNYSNIIVSIVNNEGRKVFVDTNYVVMDLHKRYDLSKLASGVYIAEVKAGDETFYYTVTR